MTIVHIYARDKKGRVATWYDLDIKWIALRKKDVPRMKNFEPDKIEEVRIILNERTGRSWRWP